MYKHLLFATDLSFISFNVGLKAQQIADTWGARLSLVHIIEPPVLYSFDFASQNKLLKERMHDAKRMLAMFAEELNISLSEQHCVMGATKDKIIDVAAELQIDLIIVGSHGVSGFTHALGSTAQSILNNAHCDVLTLNVKALPPLVKPKNESIFVHPFIENALPFQEGYFRTHPEKLKDIAEPSGEGPKLFGSKKGTPQAARHGPKPGLRPPGTPYGRPGWDEEEEDKK